MSISDRVKEILSGLPGDVELLAAVKGRTCEEIDEAISAGINVIGHNYVQEAEITAGSGPDGVRCHLIGHLQKNKAKKAVRLFDLIETVDSIGIASEIDKRSSEIGKIMPVLIEVNSAEELAKAGISPGDAVDLARKLSGFANIKIKGIMTMGPYSGDPEDARPYFKIAREIFDEIREMDLEGIDMEYLSMGMSHSYKVAVEEGANIVRIGTKIFGER